MRAEEKTERGHDQLFEQVVERILRVSSPERILLFGSRARNTASVDSDIDLLVVQPGVRHRRAHGTMLRRALRGLGVPIDVLVATPEDLEQYGDAIGLIYAQALREGQVLYERYAA